MPPTFEQAERALQALAKHPLGHDLRKVHVQLDRLLFYRLDCHRGLGRTGPEWLWRDFRAPQPRTPSRNGCARGAGGLVMDGLSPFHPCPKEVGTQAPLQTPWSGSSGGAGSVLGESVIWMHCKSEACR